MVKVYDDAIIQLRKLTWHQAHAQLGVANGLASTNASSLTSIDDNNVTLIIGS